MYPEISKLCNEDKYVFGELVFDWDRFPLHARVVYTYFMRRADNMYILDGRHEVSSLQKIVVK